MDLRLFRGILTLDGSVTEGAVDSAVSHSRKMEALDCLFCGKLQNRLIFQMPQSSGVPCIKGINNSKSKRERSLTCRAQNELLDSQTPALPC